jgi:hypothetical protein
MMSERDFDRLLETTLQARGPQVAAPSIAETVLSRVVATPQRRPRIRALDRRAWPAARHSIADPATIRAGRIALVAVLAMALIAASAAAGSWLLEIDHRPRLVFGSAAGGLYVADHDGSNTRQIAADGMYDEPRFSPDGRWIASDYIPPSANAFPGSGPTIDRRLVILRADGTNALDLPSMNPAWSYSWGASGGAEGWLAAALDESIVVVDPATGSQLTIPTTESFRVPVAWSPDAPLLWWTVGASTSMSDGIESITVHAVRISGSDGALRIADARSFDVRLDPRQQIREVEQLAVSPDGHTLALRARVNRWLRSTVALVPTDGGAADFLTPPTPEEPWISAWSGIRWTPDGTGVVVEVGEMVGTDAAIIRPSILPIDGSAPRPIAAGLITVDTFGGVVVGDGPVLTTDTAILVGGARSYLDVAGGQISYYDLWLSDANGEGSRRIATGTLGGDVR